MDLIEIENCQNFNDRGRLILDSLKSNFGETFRVIEPFKTTQLYERAGRCNVLKVSREDYDTIGSYCLPRLRDKVFSLLARLGPHQFTSPSRDNSNWDSTLDLLIDFTRLVILTQETFYSFCRSDDLIDSGSGKDHALIIPFYRFFRLVLDFDYLAAHLRELVISYQVYIKSISSIPTTNLEFPVKLWRDIAVRTTECLDAIDGTVSRISISDHQYFLDRWQSAAISISESIEYLDRLVISRSPGVVHADLTDGASFQEDNDPDEDEDEDDDEGESDIFGNDNYAVQNLAFSEKGRSSMKLCLQVLLLLRLFINKASRKEHDQLLIFYRLSIFQLCNLDSEFKSWRVLSSSWVRIFNTSYLNPSNQRYDCENTVNRLLKSIKNVGEVFEIVGGESPSDQVEREESSEKVIDGNFNGSDIEKEGEESKKKVQDLGDCDELWIKTWCDRSSLGTEMFLQSIQT